MQQRQLKKGIRRVRNMLFPQGGAHVTEAKKAADLLVPIGADVMVSFCFSRR